METRQAGKYLAMKRARVVADHRWAKVLCGGVEFVKSEYRPAYPGREENVEIYVDQGLLEFEPDPEPVKEESPLELMGLDPAAYNLSDLEDVLESITPYSYDVLADMLESEAAGKNRKGAIELIQAVIDAQQGEN